MTIEYKPLSSDQKTFIKKALCNSSTLIAKWSTQFCSENEYTDFRRAILKSSQNPLDKIPDYKLYDFKRDLQVILMPRTATHDILEGRTIEMAVLEGHAGICQKFAQTWSKDNMQYYEDNLQEAYASIISSMYCYSKTEYELITFFTTAIRNRMINLIAERSFIQMPVADYNLYTDYSKQIQTANSPVNFDTIVSMMGLDEKESARLSNILSQVNIERTVFSKGEEEEHDNYANRTSIKMQAPGCAEQTDAKNAIIRALDRANLNPEERLVIETQLNDDSRGWQTRLVDKLTMLRSGKSVSRMHISNLKKSAYKKMAPYLEEWKEVG